MSLHQYTPGGNVARWLYGIATGFGLFTGFAQMPIMKRYYIADLPGMAWSADFYITSDLHYLTAALLLGLLAWRLVLSGRLKGVEWTWGPRSAWGWLLLALLVVSGAVKVLRNYGIYIPPVTMMWMDFVHLGSAMAFMFTGLVSLIKGRRPVRA